MKMLILLVLLLISTGNCQYGNSFQFRYFIRGLLTSDDQSILPYGSQITVSLVDASLQDAPARPLNNFVLYGSYRFPIRFELMYVPTSYSQRFPQLSLQARIEKDGQLLYINDQYIPVNLNMLTVNIPMKNIGNSNPFGTYTTQSPNGFHGVICQLPPDTGFCYASIQQYYYNIQSRMCQIFVWGGCGGNGNRFSTREQCERTCSYYRRNWNTKRVQTP